MDFFRIKVKTVISVTSGAVEHGRHFQLNLSFEHNLKRTAFNFCFGPFGGVKGMCTYQICYMYNHIAHSNIYLVKKKIVLIEICLQYCIKIQHFILQHIILGR